MKRFRSREKRSRKIGFLNSSSLAHPFHHFQKFISLGLSISSPRAFCCGDYTLSRLIDEVFTYSRDALHVLSGRVHRTPLDFSRTFSRLSGNSVYMKLENMQKTGSFKIRGAFYKIWRHLDDAKRRGVVAASSGNHAQGVAYAASLLGVEATIVMPETTPVFKVNATRGYGARVVLHGSVYDEAYRKALDIAEESKALFVHPFDDLEVIAGQGTIGFEIAEQIQSVDTVLVPVGGGGLISGIGAVLKRLRPGVRIVGVEPRNAPKYSVSRQHGRIVEVEPTPSLADAVITKCVGEKTFEIMNEVVDDVVTVDEDSIARAIYLLMERSKIVVEGAGALPLAALLEGYMHNSGKNVVLVVSGGNIDLTTLYRVVLRGLASDGRVSILRMVLRDSPGELLKALNIFYRHRCNIIDVRHDRYSLYTPVGYATVEIVFEAPEQRIVEELRKELEKSSIKVL
ncbi:MAG: threonine ammonia-lyase [Ignisphaera sp.]